MTTGSAQTGSGDGGQFAGLPRRVAVVGSPGAGKSSLSRRLAQVCAVTPVHLDDLYWYPGWRRPTDADWRAEVAGLASGESWLVDGNYAPTLPERIGRAQAVVLVDAPVLLCLYRVVRRAVRIRAGCPEELPARIRAQAAAGERVRATQDFGGLLRLVITFRRRRREILRLVAEAEHAPALVIVPWRAGRLVDIDRLVSELCAIPGRRTGVTSDTAHVDGGC